jgi:hypothetical protein
MIYGFSEAKHVEGLAVLPVRDLANSILSTANGPR